jgi:hypothetical protein
VFAQEAPPYSGTYFGRGNIWEKALDDPFRKLTRRSEAEFWFSIDRAGKVSGEGYVSYHAELKALKWKVGPIDAEVEGSSEKLTFKFQITGEVAGGLDSPTLTLKAVGQDENMTIAAFAFDFSIVARVNLPSVAGAPATSPEIRPITISAKGWSPFQGLKPPLVKHGAGLYTVDGSSSGEKFGIHWHAFQMSAGQSRELLEIVLKLQKDVDDLKRQLTDFRPAKD